MIDTPPHRVCYVHLLVGVLVHMCAHRHVKCGGENYHLNLSLL